MKNLIIQYYIDTSLYTQPNFNNLGPSPVEKYSSHSFQLYCKKYDIDYIKITNPKLRFKHPTWERFDLWCDRSWWDKYDQICYVDSDVISLPGAGNIFKEFKNPNAFKVCYYRKFTNNTANGSKKRCSNNPLMDTIPGEVLKEKCWQTGLFILSKESAEKMRNLVLKYKEQPDVIDDGMFINWATIASNVDLEKISETYNTKNNGGTMNLKGVNFLHCAGGKKHKQGVRVFEILKNLYPAVRID
jgi:hypothetical protein